MKAIQDLLETMARLRGPGGCPWDHEQTHASLCKPLIDETMELLDTIDREDMDHMREELGDVLLQVVFHAQIAQENGHFGFDDVARDINTKLVRRHPHVFGDMDLKNTDEVLVQWEEIKRQEKAARGLPETKSRFKELPPRLPALFFAHDTYKQMRKEKISHDRLISPEAVDSIAEMMTEELAGERLFSLAAACRQADIDPESALRRYTQKMRDLCEDAE